MATTTTQNRNVWIWIVAAIVVLIVIGLLTDWYGLARDEAAMAPATTEQPAATTEQPATTTEQPATTTEQPATGIVLHPADWTGMRLLKNAEGEYILGDPGSDAPARLFGVDVVATQAMIAGKFLTGVTPGEERTHDDSTNCFVDRARIGGR